MSYEIVRSVKIDKKNNKVYINCASNNCWPHTFQKHLAPILTKTLEEKGEVQVIKDLLYCYYTGEFQPGGQNYYSKALTLLDHKKYNWRNGNEHLFKPEEVQEELYKHYLTLKSEPSGKFIISSLKEYHGKVYISKFTKRHARFTKHIGLARVYRKKSDIEQRLQNYERKNYTIEEL